MVTHAAVGVIRRGDGLVLLGKRPVGKPWADYWEFPGGKVEMNETPAQALVRELQEELGITPTLYYPWLTRHFDYQAQYDVAGHLISPAKSVHLHFFTVMEWQGDPLGLEQQVIRWQDPENVTVAPMLPANAPILQALTLPSLYALTNLSELGEDLFFERLKIALENGLRMIQIREKQLSHQNLLKFVARVIDFAKPYQAKVFLNSDSQALDDTLRLGLTGLHFTAQALIHLQIKPAGMLCGASCHNLEELLHAQALGLDYVLLSPVQATLSHVEATPLGWAKFSELIAGYSLPVYALGGMSADDLHQARLHGAHGIAAQRGFW